MGLDPKDVNETIRYQLHDWIRKLIITHREEHASWAEDWYHCLAYLCQCQSCIRLLEEDQVDIQMIRGILQRNM